ncbi:MAG: hypothetical protein ACJAW3_000481 [Lentimonas sp.]|jgi:hypothetical protein
MLKWSRDDLREISGLGRETIGNFEREFGNATTRTQIDLKRAFKDAGIRFENDDEGQGVKLLNKTK